MAFYGKSASFGPDQAKFRKPCVVYPNLFNAPQLYFRSQSSEHPLNGKISSKPPQNMQNITPCLTGDFSPLSDEKKIHSFAEMFYMNSNNT